MNKDNAAQYLPLAQALAEGKTVQFYDYDSGQWKDSYRIKPEPRELWLVEINNPVTPGAPWRYAFVDRAQAEQFARDTAGEFTYFKAVE